MVFNLNENTLKFENTLKTIYCNTFDYRCTDVGRLRKMYLHGRVRTTNGDICVDQDYTVICRYLRIEKMINARPVETIEILVGTRRVDVDKAYRLLVEWKGSQLSELEVIFENNKLIDKNGKVVIGPDNLPVEDPLPNPKDFDSLAHGALCSIAANSPGALRREALKQDHIVREDFSYKWADETAVASEVELV
jgi:hypothetical protein